MMLAKPPSPATRQVAVPPIVVILLFLAIAVAGVYAWRQDQKRQEAVREWAFGRGWRVWPGGDWGPHTEYPAVKLFQRGHSRSSGTIVRGQVDGRDIALFDYKYVTGSGKNRTTHRRGVVVVRTDFPVLPLEVRPENALDKVGEFFGRDDIDFESAEFSSRFYVSSPDRKWAYDIIHARVMELLLREAAEFTIEFGNFEVALHRRGYCDPSRYEHAVRLAQRLLELVPDYVVRQMKGEAP